MTKKLSEEEKITLAYVRAAATAISNCVQMSPEKIDWKERAAEHLDDLNEIERWLLSEEAPCKCSVSKQSRMSIMARSFLNAVEAMDAGAIKGNFTVVQRLSSPMFGPISVYGRGANSHLLSPECPGSL
jgi:hypothetical protein